MEGAAGDLSSLPVLGGWPSVAPCISRALCAAPAGRGAMGRVSLQPGPSVRSWESRGERREGRPGKEHGEMLDAPREHPPRGRGELQTLEELVDVLPMPAFLSPGTTGE